MARQLDRVDMNGVAADWFGAFDRALDGRGELDVPCNGCTACCRASQFIPVEPDETDTLARIPKALLFEAPGGRRGHRVMGYDKDGHCPMLVDDRCSIYDHRPRACRVYDCRVFAASGTFPSGEGQADVAERAREWEVEGSAEAAAARAAGAYLAAHREIGPPGETQRAVVAVQLRGLFRAAAAGGEPPAGDAVAVSVDRIRRGAR